MHEIIDEELIERRTPPDPSIALQICIKSLLLVFFFCLDQLLSFSIELKGNERSRATVSFITSSAARLRTISSLQRFFPFIHRLTNERERARVKTEDTGYVLECNPWNKSTSDEIFFHPSSQCRDSFLFASLQIFAFDRTQFFFSDPQFSCIFYSFLFDFDWEESSNFRKRFSKFEISSFSLLGQDSVAGKKLFKYQTTVWFVTTTMDQGENVWWVDRRRQKLLSKWSSYKNRESFENRVDRSRWRKQLERVRNSRDSDFSTTMTLWTILSCREAQKTCTLRECSIENSILGLVPLQLLEHSMTTAEHWGALTLFDLRVRNMIHAK